MYPTRREENFPNTAVFQNRYKGGDGRREGAMMLAADYPHPPFMGQNPISANAFFNDLQRCGHRNFIQGQIILEH